MGPEIIKTNGNVMLVEPNSVNINTDVVNGIPDYEDMYIFAELTAQSKSRTVIINSDVKSTSSKKVNFIGNNQDETGDNPNYLNFTTNYYDGSTGNNTHYEGFGINNIKIVINSSFIPQVSIQFVDLRGLAFFNQADSPYRILFDFPPPIFTLTVKGYYGKPVTYRLHLVKYTSEFSSANGNFIIDANFIAMTFAPLSDILFRYIVNAPLIDDAESMIPAPNEEPRNTYELILKLKNLYKAVSERLESDEDNKRYEQVLDDLEKINEINGPNGILNHFIDNEALNVPGRPYLVWREPTQYIFPKINSVPDEKLTSIDTISEFDTVIGTEQSSGEKSMISQKLFITYLTGTGIKVGNNTETSPTYTAPSPQYFANPQTKNNKGFNDALTAYKELLKSSVDSITSITYENDDIKDPKEFLNSYNVDTKKISQNPQLLASSDGYVSYYGIDISKYYYKIFKQKVALEKERNTLAMNITTTINNMVSEELGMVPSIYNIFKIILDDVDTFFSKLRTVSEDAYDSHQNDANKKIILGDGGYAENPDTEIYSFPLIVNRDLDGREERIAPIDLSKKVQFPEMKLVNDFIDTFLQQRRLRQEYDLRDDQADDGTYKWIPISPFDSTLGGATPRSPYLGISDDIRGETLQILMKRFYMLTQGTLPEAFYVKPVDERRKDKQNVIVNEAYVKLYANAEAINLASALVSPKNISAVQTMANQYNSNLEKFYDHIKTVSFTYNNGSQSVTSNIYDFPTNDPKYFLINPSISTNGRVYVDKNNENFEGVYVIDGDVDVQTTEKKGSNPIDAFFGDTDNKKIFSGGDPAEHFFEFTKDNLIYIRDKIGKGYVTNDIDGIPLRTRYLSPREYFVDGSRNANFPGEGLDDAARQEIAYEQGNSAFTYARNKNESLLNQSLDIATHWSDILGSYDTSLIDTITGSSEMSSLLILSNFGYTASPFNKYPNSLNSIVFDTPAAVEVPAYYAPYLGALLTAIENDWVDEIKTFFMTGPGSNLPNRGFYILADLHDVENYLSEKDKQEMKTAYTAYMGKYNKNIRNGILGMYKDVKKNSTAGINFNSPGYIPTHAQIKASLYRYFLDENDKLKNEDKIDGTKALYFGNVLRNLIVRKNLLNYSQITFQIPTPNTSGYTSLKTINENGIGTLSAEAAKTINDNYFSALFQKLGQLVVERNNEVKEEEEELKRSKGDSDVINQLYYSFKNINDKWLTGTAKPKGIGGYPFNADGKRMIDLFAFVDRGMNPIGETILNAEILINMMDDVNVSLFTVLSQLLSLNGFEFFPLQNFLSFESETSWTDSFKIYDGTISDEEKTYFVCMYIGGTSSYPSVSGNGFQNDGIIDITEPGVKGFEKSTTASQYTENQNQVANDDFPFSEVRAFRVRFGEQNQSMFTDMKIDSKEYPETNESIQILSRLAGDNNPDAGVPKGQNLYNLYENRSYKATVTGFGNATIQPTQYFQLENIPLFNGAYIILSVEHNITANKMTTSFSGTKLLKYPMPRVLDPVALMNFDSQSIGEFTARALSTGRTAKNMSKVRLDQLDSEYGIDVSHHNGVIDWKKVKADGVTFAFMKLTEGMTYYSGDEPDYDINTSISNALKNKINLSYYHFARFGRTTDPVQDGYDDATNFIIRLNALDKKPELPVVLDLEEDCFNTGDNYKWSNTNQSINEYTESFINTMGDAGYDVMIYCRTGLINQWGLNNFSKYPFWVARYMDTITNNPESNEPTVPKEWKDGWTAWQFSPTGMVNGVKSNVDINAMKKNYIKKYT